MRYRHSGLMSFRIRAVMMSMPLDSWVTMQVCGKDRRDEGHFEKQRGNFSWAGFYLVLLAGTLAVFSEGLQRLNNQVDV